MKPVVSALCVGVTLFTLAALAGCNDTNRRGNRGALTIPASAKTAAIPASVQTPAPADPAKPAEVEPPAKAVEAEPAVAPSGPLSASQGYYVGMFVAEEMDEKKNPMASNKINVAIDSIDGERVSGHSIVAGNDTPFSGTLKPAKDKGKYELALTEPEGKNSGVFTATLDTKAKSVTGTWVSHSKSAAVTKRSYDLVKTAFKYDPKQELGETWSQLYESSEPDNDRYESITDAAGKFNASVKLLKSKDVENMYKRDLEVMRNAIYARHGYSFNNRQMRYFFDNFVDWYVPVKTNVTAELTELETKNIALIKRYEKHADKYYDSYGR